MDKNCALVMVANITTSRRRAQGQLGVMPDPDPDPDPDHDHEPEPELEPIEQEGVMPDPPSNWPPISTTTSSMLNHTSSRESQQVQEEQLAAPSSGLVESSRTRGPTLMHSGWGEDGGTLHITVNRLGQPILKQASRLASNLGVLARNGILAPLTYVDWRIVAAHIKNNIWAHIKENTDATDRMRDYLMMSFSRKWKEWKAIAKREGYTPYTTTQERLSHRPQRVEERQWRKFVHYRDSEKAKLKSVRNKASRALLTMPHTSGRKSLPQVREELTQQNNGVEPTRREVYKTTHTKKDGNASSEAAARAIKDMENLHAQHPESPEVGFIRNDMYGQVMGPERHGRVWTLGLGPTPTNIFGSSHRQFKIERRDTELRHQQELERMRVQMEAENEKMKANMEAKIQRVRDEMTLQMQQNERNRAENEEMKEKESDTQVEIETMQAQIRELLAHIRNPGVSVQSQQDISSATGQVPDALSGENRMQRQTEDRATKRQQMITQNQLLNYREERIAKKRKQY